jgi:uncharacterized membrane protein
MIVFTLYSLHLTFTNINSKIINTILKFFLVSNFISLIIILIILYVYSVSVYYHDSQIKAQLSSFPYLNSSFSNPE